MWNGTQAVLAAVLCLTLCAEGAARAEDLAPGCAEEGDGLVSAIEELSPRELETLAGRLLGPDIARLVRGAPWDAVWQGTSRDEAPYFIQRFGQEPRLPPVRFALAAPPPLELEAELRLQPGTECLAFDVPRDFSNQVSPEEGEVTLRGPMRVQLTLSVAGFSKRWELPATDVSVDWTHMDPEGHLSTRFLVGDLKFGLPAPGAKESVSTTWDTLRWRHGSSQGGRARSCAASPSRPPSRPGGHAPRDAGGPVPARRRLGAPARVPGGRGSERR